MAVVILKVLMVEGGLYLSLLAYQTAFQMPPQLLPLPPPPLQLEDQSLVD